MIRERIAFGARAVKSAYSCRLATALSAASSSSVTLDWALRTQTPTDRSDEASVRIFARRSGAPAWRSAAFCWAFSALSSDALARATASSAAISRPLCVRSPTLRQGGYPVGEMREACPQKSENHKFSDLWRRKMHLVQIFYRAQPVLGGLHVSCGFLQSIPSSI